MTQFWDTNPAVGPDDSWTIHGLWPDNCDGTFKNGCDPSREYPSPKALLETAGRQDLIDFMSANWVNNAGGTEEFWKHEWDNHGTCYSTLNPSCLPPDSPKGSEAVLFFDRVVELFKTLPTFKSLSAAGIEPSTTATYKLADMEEAIRSSFGKTVGLDCSKNNLQVYYWFNLKGSVIDGELVPIDAPKPGSCKATGIKYLPKTSSKGRRHTKRH
jgi:ribonuclease T2